MRIALTALALFIGACGAKTGLDAPDLGPDLGVDLGPDLGPPPPPPPVCIEVPRDAGPVDVSFELPVALAVVDVFFLLDATASMVDEIETIREGLQSRVVPGVRAAIPDAAFGVALFGEFPVSPHGPAEVQPFVMRRTVTTDVVQVESALSSLPSWGNFDEPEAATEGLYQVATGEGLDPWILRSDGCPGGGTGGACFRSTSLPVILLITDAPMNNGPAGVAPVSTYDFEGPHTYAEALEALDRVGALVIGLWATDFGTMSPSRQLRRVSTDTGAVVDGDPLARSIGGGGDGVGAGIVNAITGLAEGTPLDVDARVEDVRGDAIDARDLVVAVEPVSAEPSDGVTAIVDGKFLGTRPGTRVTFRVVVDTSSVPDSAATVVVPARIVFRAFERSRLGSEEVLIVIPGDDGGSCDDLP
tara:strand:+ start:2234 stop:3481 length:1248 start_codon:yes stop_codon:yes gene_type:complete